MFKKSLTIISVVVLIIFISYFIFISSAFCKIFKCKVTEEKVKIIDSDYNYGVIIDAGSSGSRLFIYFWPPHTGNGGELLQMRPLLDNKGKPIVKKVNPGLSSFADHPENVISYIKPLLELAKSSIPKSLHKETPFYLMATAGMRMITNEAQTAILNNIRQFVKHNYAFLFSDSHAKVISGQEEGIFGWITTNYLLGRFNHNHSDGVPIIPVPVSDSVFRSEQFHHRKRTVGVIDMGGGSMQIAYELEPNAGKDFTDSAVTFNLGCRENDADHTYKVFVTTFLGFGANSARTRYERILVRDYMRSHMNYSQSSNSTESHSSPAPLPTVIIEDACLHKGSEISQKVKLVNDSQGGLQLSSKQIRKLHSVKAVFRGTGKYHQCESRLATVLNRIPCPTMPISGAICTMSGRIHPAIDLASTQFYGFSEFWYSTQDVLGLGGKYNYFRLHSESVEHCGKDWASLTFDYKKGIYKAADWPRMRYQCFKSAWITNVLHQGLGFPNAFSKFISVQEINGAEVQWSLGALLYQTRYFPLRVIEQKELERRKLQKEIRNRPKHIFIYVFLFVAVSMVLVTVFWMHNRGKWRQDWLMNSYRKDSYETGTKGIPQSTESIYTKIQMAHNSGPMKDFRSSPNFKHWT